MKFLNSKHTLTKNSFIHTQSFPKPDWCQQQNSSTSWNDSGSDIWQTITWSCHRWLMGALQPDGVQVALIAGSQTARPAFQLHVYNLHILKYMAEKLPLSKGQICKMCSTAPECRNVLLQVPLKRDSWGVILAVCCCNDLCEVFWTRCL